MTPRRRAPREQVQVELAMGDPARGYYAGADNRLESALAFFETMGFIEARCGLGAGGT